MTDIWNYDKIGNCIHFMSISYSLNTQWWQETQTRRRPGKNW